jgi:hypothetical protein
MAFDNRTRQEIVLLLQKTVNAPVRLKFKNIFHHLDDITPYNVMQ